MFFTPPVNALVFEESVFLALPLITLSITCLVVIYKSVFFVSERGTIDFTVSLTSSISSGEVLSLFCEKRHSGH